MKSYIKIFFDNEVLAYLFFGVATTLVAVSTRLLVFHWTDQEQLATIIGNIAGIIFAFVTNDTIVFKQQRKGWFKRLIAFGIARLGTLLLDVLLTFLFVTQYPQIIGQFVNMNRSAINGIETIFAQVLIIVLNYIFSKVFVFRNKK